MATPETDGNVLIAHPDMLQMTEQILWMLNDQARKDERPLFGQVPLSLKGFANSEHEPKLMETVRGAHAYVLYPMQLPDPDKCLIGLHILKDALTCASVGKISLVLPYLPYMRQDRRKDNERVPISARAIAKVIQPGAEHVITMDLHADQEVGFFDIPVDNIPGSVVFIEDIKRRYNDDLRTVTAVAPDVGSAARVRRIAHKLNVPMAIIDKDRQGPGQAKVMEVFGKDRIAYRHAIIFDDLIDSGGTIINAAQAMKNYNAASVEIYATHGLFTGEACAKFAKAEIPVRVANTIPRSEEFVSANSSWLTFVPIEQLLADAIYQTTRIRGSISKLSA